MWYTRTTCSNTTGTKLQYAGRAAGTWFSHGGGGANILCLPDRPHTLPTLLEYKVDGHICMALSMRLMMVHFALSTITMSHVQCVTHRTVMMIPAQYACPSSWTREYYGYLMTSHYGHGHTIYKCVDISPQSVCGSIANTCTAKTKL